MKAELREMLGKAVRDEWVIWAQEQTNPKPSHLVPWSELDEANKEVDRRIGEAVARHLAALVGVPMLRILLSEDDVRSLLERL